MTSESWRTAMTKVFSATMPLDKEARRGGKEDRGGGGGGRGVQAPQLMN